MSTFVRVPGVPVELVFGVPITSEAVMHWIANGQVVVIPDPERGSMEYVLNWGAIAHVEVSDVPRQPLNRQVDCAYDQEKHLSVQGSYPRR